MDRQGLIGLLALAAVAGCATEDGTPAIWAEADVAASSADVPSADTTTAVPEVTPTDVPEAPADVPVVADVATEPDVAPEPDVASEPDVATEPDIATEPDVAVDVEPAPDVEPVPDVEPAPEVAEPVDAGPSVPCIGIKPAASAAVPSGTPGTGDCTGTCLGADLPVWALTDFQPQSCGYASTYGLDTYKGHVTFVALLASW